MLYAIHPFVPLVVQGVVAGKAKHPVWVAIAVTDVAVASVHTYCLQAPDEKMHFYVLVPLVPKFPQAASVKYPVQAVYDMHEVPFETQVDPQA